MDSAPRHTGSIDAALIRADVDRARLRAHAANSPAAVAAGLLVACMLVAVIGTSIGAPRLWAWLAALGLVLALRLGLWRAQRRSPAADADSPRWLARYRVTIVLHGVVWGAVAWLPATVGDAQQQAALVFLLSGMAIGAMTLGLFDLWSALPFAVCTTLPLTLRLLALPVSAATQVALLMAALLLCLLSLAAHRADRERLAQAGAMRAEAASARGALAAEQGLAGQQRKLALVLENTAQGFWTIDNAMCTTDANPAMCRMLGLSRAEMLGRSVYDFVDAANAQIFRDHARLRAVGQAEGYEIALTRSDGSQVYCYNNATPVFDDSGCKTGALGLFSDISAQKRAEQQIRLAGELLTQKSQLLAATLDNLSQGVLSVDAAGRCNAWNRRFAELLEIPEAMMQTAPLLSDLRLYQAEQGHFGISLERFDDIGRQSHLRALRGEPDTAGFRYQRTRADGLVLDVASHVAADGSLVRTYTDVTASVKAEQALRESETRFRTMADGAPALIWLAGANGAPTWFNQRWLAHTGLTLAQGLAMHWTEVIHPQDIGACRLAYAQAISQRMAYSVEFRLRRADGGWGWIADQGIPRFAADGRFEGCVSYGWDIGSRKAAEVGLIAARDEAERARAQAEQANRAKSDFLSRMSHELRTPLNAILGFGQLLAADADDPLSPGQRRRVAELLRGGSHLLELINEVLDLARIEAGSLQLALQPVDVVALAGDCLSLVQPVAQARGVTLLPPVTIDGCSCLAMADASRLRQVLLNLLSNAIKFNRDGGEVRVACRCDAQGTVIEVADQGPGIAPGQLPRLFQPFERLDVDGAIEGTGIGLALSRSLAALMHGEIGVRSSLGEGSVFWIRLPRCLDGAAALSPPEQGAARLAPGLRQSVLYIEDNEVNQLLMEGMLAHRPLITLRLAGLPADGLALAAAEAPDLVLLDIQLPGMDGFEVLRRLRALPALCNTPVIAVSANAMPGDLQAAERAGFADYLTKPVHLPRLLALVDRALAAAAPTG